VADRHYLTTEQAQRIDRILKWYDRLGRHLRLTTPQPTIRPDLTPPVNRRFKAFLKGSMSSTDSTQTVDGVVKITGRSPTTSSTAEVTVSNVHGWDGDDNALSRVEWTAGSSQWEFYQINCPST
jgi:hypothetical protein